MGYTTLNLVARHSSEDVQVDILSVIFSNGVHGHTTMCRDGYTALQIATPNDETCTIDVLMEGGAKVKAQTEGF